MALFPNVEGGYSFGGKTHNNLVVSEGVAPAEKWIVSKKNGFKPFTYEFGPEGNQLVVLPKGKIVELGEAEYDHQTGREVSTIKMAEPNSRKAVGVLHHNVYETRRGRFSGNDQPNPVVLTRQYIEVPLFESTTAEAASGVAAAMRFGAAYGGEDNKIQPGDFVKVGDNGNFVKLNAEGEEADSPFEIVGQVLAVERELPPAGFLQYYMGGEVPELEAFMKAQGYAPSPGSNGSDAGAFPMGSPYSPGSWKADFAKKLGLDIDKGIPFLTDGYFKAKEKKTGITLDRVYDAKTDNDFEIESVRYAGEVELSGTDVVVAEGSKNNAVFIKMRHAIDKTEADHVSVTSGGVKLASTDVHVDYAQNVIVVYLEENKTYADLKITANLIVDPIAGIPTEWDYSGSVGAVRILLQR